METSRTQIRSKKWVKSFLPLIIMGNVRSLADKMDELGLLMRTQQEYQEGNYVFFIENWLQKHLTPHL